MDVRSAVIMSLIMVAGCNGHVPEFGLEVQSVAESDSGYSLSTEIWYEEGSEQTAIFGYTARGDRLCAKSVSSVEGNVSTTLSCPELPSVLLLADGNETTIDTIDQVEWYAGRQNGSHRYRTLAENEPFASAPQRVFNRNTPHPLLFNATQCQQWQSGGDFSALQNPPWMSWERVPPNSTRTYSVHLDNNTRNVLEENDSVWDYPDSIEHPAIYGPEVLTPSVRSTISEIHGTNEDIAGASLNRSEYYRFLSRLAGKPVDSSRDVRSLDSKIDGVSDEINGTIGYSNTSRIECFHPLPKYGGFEETRTTVQIRYERAIYRVNIITRLRYDGTAVATG